MMKYIYLNGTKVLIPEAYRVSEDSQSPIHTLDSSQPYYDFFNNLPKNSKVYFENGNYTNCTVNKTRAGVIYQAYFSGVYDSADVMVSYQGVSIIEAPPVDNLEEAQTVSFLFSDIFTKPPFSGYAPLSTMAAYTAAGELSAFQEDMDYDVTSNNGIIHTPMVEEFAKAAFGELYQYIHSEPRTYTAYFVRPLAATGTPPDPISGEIVDPGGYANIILPENTDIALAGKFFYGWAKLDEEQDPTKWLTPHTVVRITEDTQFIAVFQDKNPDYPGTPTDPAGGNGSLEITTDEIPIPSTPTSIVMGTGNIVTMFKPTVSELRTLADELWGTSVIDALKNLYTNPNEAVISLGTTPFTPDVGTNKSYWKIGGLTVAAPMDIITSQFAEFDFGSVQIPEVWGNSLDYGNHTHIQIVLPYIGARTVDTDAVMGGSCNLKYRVDLLSGGFCAYLYVTKNGKSNCLYQWTGEAMNKIPLNSRDFSQTIGSIISAAGSIAAGIATGGASTAISAAAIGGAAGNIAGINAGTISADKASGNIGVLGNRTAYFIINRPVQNIVANYNKYVGYPTRQEYLLSTMSGYTEISEVHMDGFPATEAEISLIEQKLKGGVIL